MIVSYFCVFICVLSFSGTFTSVVVFTGFLPTLNLKIFVTLTAVYGSVIVQLTLYVPAFFVFTLPFTLNVSSKAEADAYGELTFNTSFISNVLP